MEKTSKRQEIYAIRDIPGKNSQWTRIGVGFPNKDGSVTLKFDFFPTSPDVSIQLRDPRFQGQTEKSE